jgi:hypothetical protein
MSRLANRPHGGTETLFRLVDFGVLQSTSW